jgi:hypothetical protein
LKAVNQDLLDWSVGGQYIDAIKAAGFDGAIFKERPGTINPKEGGGFDISGDKIYSTVSFKNRIPVFDDLHKNVVVKAIENGMNVPDNVLNDYPDLRV